MQDGVYRSVCPLDCPDACGLMVRVEGCLVTQVRGDPDHPFTKGFICAKMGHYPDLINSPARILTPLKRTGPKGAGQFAPITWEEAVNEIVTRWGGIITTRGAEAILPYSYGGGMGLVQRNAGHPFFHRLGASRLKRTICSPASTAGWQMVMGNSLGTDPEAVIHADLVVLWGIDAVATNLHFASRVREAQRRGARVVLVEVYKSRTATLADQLVLVRPGTDTALALGMMHVLAGEDLVDTAFIDRHVLGFPELKANVLPAFPPTRVEELTGVPAKTIRQLARDYGRARSPFIRIGRGLSRHEQGAMSVRAISCLPALVGAYAREGGGAFFGTGTGMAFAMERVTRPDLLARPTREINMVRLGRALTEAMEPPVQSLYVYHSNPAAVVPEQNLVLSGLSREDLFTVVHERFMTDTARYADIILPATFSVEQHDLYGSYGHFYVQRTRPVVAPPATAKSNWQAFTLLARALGWSEEPFLRSEEEMVDELLAHETPFLKGIDREALSLGRAVHLNTGHLKTPPFQTASGRIEMYAADAAANRSLPVLPAYQSNQDPEWERLYPFCLLTTPANYLLNSSFAQMATLGAREGGPRVLLNPEDCLAQGFADGEYLEVYNHRGSCLLRAFPDDAVPPGVAVIPGVWWLKDLPAGRNVNSLVGDDLTDMGEGSTFYAYRVNLRRLQP